ncbi:hypothetical protein FOL75_26705 [Bacillus thuringiensis]|uniref:hypothetical protein n=1 Tax=Bacillus thuringiensis TaxID=1428 RepID=UPI002853C77C|nr:hypothetical protein [Bacillus thuringiensis]MDR5025382.1 hypothetical protein [Bacillus thuringiensis]
MTIELNAQQQQLQEEIVQNLAIVKEAIHGNNNENCDEAFDKMAVAAHQLHISLTPAPTHHVNMLRNRGVSPEDPVFYQHVHPVEDLLAYLEDPTANDAPVDQTLDTTFNMTVFSSRWGHTDNYTVVRNADGWHTSFMSLSEQGGKDAQDSLAVLLRHDSIAYPHDLAYVMEDLWNQAADRGLSQEQVQAMLDEVANWIIATEKNYPGFVQ